MTLTKVQGLPSLLKAFARQNERFPVNSIAVVHLCFQECNFWGWYFSREFGCIVAALQILLFCLWLCSTHRKRRHNTSSELAL